MATREQINAILKLLATLPNCPIQDAETRDMVESMYFAALGDVPIEYLQAAYLQYIGGNNPFFPSNPGTLREIAFDLEMTAQGIPTGAQAWAMVLSGKQTSKIKKCAMAQSIENEIADLDRPGIIKTPDVNEKLLSLNKQGYEHWQTCKECVSWDSTEREWQYDNEVVSRVVYLMGGRDVIFTDNTTADRARFLEAYRELVTLERRKLQMHPQVAALIANPDRPKLGTPAEGMKMLAAKMGGSA